MDNVKINAIVKLHIICFRGAPTNRKLAEISVLNTKGINWEKKLPFYLLFIIVLVNTVCLDIFQTDDEWLFEAGKPRGVIFKVMN